MFTIQVKSFDAPQKNVNIARYSGHSQPGGGKLPTQTGITGEWPSRAQQSVPERALRMETEVVCLLFFFF